MVSETAKKLVLLTLQLSGGVMETDTRMQKLAFLVNQVLNWAKFEANDYGPYSKELTKAVDELEKEGKLVYVWGDDGMSILDDGVSRYFLKEKGKREARRVLEQLKYDELKRVTEIVQTHKDDPLTYLLAYIYKYYPEYAEKSKIRSKVEEWIRYFNP